MPRPCLGVVLAIASLLAERAAPRRLQDGPQLAGEGPMTITRQGVTLYSGETQRYAFAAEHLHKEFVLHFLRENNESCDKPVFVRYEKGRLCGTGPFTRKQLTCTPVADDELEATVSMYRHLAPPSDRGFSVELEMVSRMPVPQDVKKTRKQWWEFWHRSPHAKKIEEIGRVKSCFDNVTSEARSQAAYGRWNWEQDSSVKPVEASEAVDIGYAEDETEGVGFELTAPAPPHVLSGKRGLQEAMEVVTVLRHMGVQTGPSSGLHVHVNVLEKRARGKRLTQAGIANVWAAYAKYQLVIDEMYSPGRPGNAYAGRLFLGECQETHWGHCTYDPCGCSRRIFNQIHEWISSGRAEDNLSFCNTILSTAKNGAPCLSRYPDVRYAQLNLVPLHKYGTIEFRAHSATYDHERIARWVQFVVAFVDHFGAAGRANSSFFSGSLPDDYARLVEAQRTATMDELFGELEGLVDASSASYYKERKWERRDPSCKFSGQALTPGDTQCARAYYRDEHAEWTPILVQRGGGVVRKPGV